MSGVEAERDKTDGPFTSPFDGERHFFVFASAKRATKVGVDEREYDECGEGGEGIVQVMRMLLDEEKHSEVPGGLAGEGRKQ